jgi:hypothetical protein
MTEETFDPSRIAHEDAARLDYLKLLQISENNVYDTQYYTHGKLLYSAEKIHEIAESIIANIRGNYGEDVISRLQKNGFTIEKGRRPIQDRAEQAVRKLEMRAYISMARYALQKTIDVNVIMKEDIARDAADLIRAAHLSKKGNELVTGERKTNEEEVRFYVNTLLENAKAEISSLRGPSDSPVTFKIGEQIKKIKTNTEEAATILLKALGIRQAIGIDSGRAA